jgi:microcystin degradation protein MlrC
MKRVGIVGLLQESNTFLPTRTSLAEFKADVLVRGFDVQKRFHDAPHEIGGFFAGLQLERLEAVPIFAARALPYGVIAKDAFAELLATMIEELRRASPLDGLLVAPHGATVSEDWLDADGHWLSQIREEVGPDVPLVGTLDPHANVSEQMIAACDALVTYRTNPHMDQCERGVEAAQLLARTLRKEVRPVMAAAFPPVAISIECQATDESNCAPLCRYAEQLRSEPKVLAASLALGFPYSDVPEMGSSAIVVADGDRPLAQKYADDFGWAIWERRRELVGEPLAIEPAIDQALVAEPPVCLLDMGDNVGGGSPADGTWLAQALAARRIEKSLVVLFDPAAVKEAEALGVGRRGSLRIGAHSMSSSGQPLNELFTVLWLGDGQFTETRPTHGGFTSFDQGRTAVLSADSGPTIVVTSRRMVPFSLGQLRCCGLDPAAFRILVAKGVNAPLAAYREVCRTFIRVNTPGVTSADMTSLDFRRRRKPMFPFEPDRQWRPRERPRSS